MGNYPDQTRVRFLLWREVLTLLRSPREKPLEDSLVGLGWRSFSSGACVRLSQPNKRAVSQPSLLAPFAEGHEQVLTSKVSGQDISKFRRNRLPPVFLLPSHVAHAVAPLPLTSKQRIGARWLSKVSARPFRCARSCFAYPFAEQGRELSTRVYVFVCTCVSIFHPSP